MNKRWFAVILTVGLLLCLVPLSAFALNGDCITDSDGNILGWEDLTDSDLTDPDPGSTWSGNKLPRQRPPLQTHLRNRTRLRKRMMCRTRRLRTALKCR